MNPSPTDLLGRWALHRRVRDRVAGIHGTVTGTLELARAGERVRWYESGLLRWNGSTVEVRRELWVQPDGIGWLVTFDDGRPFHPWRPGEVVEHPCGRDHYRGLITASPRALDVLWDVTGPAKDQRLLTRCRRMP